MSVEDYGLLGLVSATVTIFVSFAKLGLQNAMVRFYAEAKARAQHELLTLLSNVATAAVILAVVGTCLWLLYTHLVVPQVDDTPLLRKLFLIGTALVPIKIAHSLLSNLLQADQQSHTISTISVSEKVFRLLGIIAVVMLFGLNSERALTVIITSELVFLLILFYYCRTYLSNITLQISTPVLAPLVAFGVPAMIAELTAVLLETGDRYVIQAYMGAEPLGHYAAAVNICMYLEWVLIMALQSAIVPHYLKLFEEKGYTETIQFLNGAFSLYVAIGVGIFVVFSIAAPHLIVFLAGEKYRSGLVVIPWFAAGYLLVGAISIAAAGVFINKRTILLVKWTAIAFIINITLNIIFIPRYGLLAAAIATFIAMCIRSIGVYYDAAKTFPVTIPWVTVLQALGCGVPAYFLGTMVSTGSLVLDLFAASMATGTIYTGLMMVLNAHFRTWVFVHINKRDKK